MNEPLHERNCAVVKSYLSKPAGQWAIEQCLKQFDLEKDTSTSYIPGSCNIGPTEIRRRYRIGYIGLALSLIIMVCVMVFDLPRIYRLLFFATIFYTLTGFIQAWYKFCFLYGWLGVFSMTGRKHINSVKEKEFLKQDRLKAIKIVLLVTLGSVLLTLIYYFI